MLGITFTAGCWHLAWCLYCAGSAATFVKALKHPSSTQHHECIVMGRLWMIALSGPSLDLTLSWLQDRAAD